MTENALEKALQLLSELEARINGDERKLLAEARDLIGSAQRSGEGADAAALRQQIAEMQDDNAKFTSVMVHEIRKPMTSIRGYSDMLAKNVMGELNPMQSQFVNTIRTNTISMEQLVADISDLTKMRSGRMQTSPKMEMFKNIAMKLEKELTEKAEARGLKLSFEVPSGLPLMNLDSMRVEQALTKLIENAIKYTPEGGGEIRVVAESLGDRLKVSVIDRGIGMSEQDRQRLGELFFRGDDELVMMSKGYGMGIPIVLECMKIVKGEAFWQTEKGKGSTFGIVVPAMS